MQNKNKILSLLLSTVLFFSPFITFAEKGEGFRGGVGVNVNASFDDDDNDDNDDNGGMMSDDDNDNDDDSDSDDGGKMNKGENHGWGIKQGFIDWRTEFTQKKADFQKARDDWKNAKPADKEGLKLRFGMAIFGRFDVVATGLENLHDRIKARMDAETTLSTDARTKASAELDLAQKDIDSLKVKAEAIKTIIESDISASEKQAKQEELKKDITDAKALVKSAHEHLKNSFKIIKLDLNANASAKTN